MTNSTPTGAPPAETSPAPAQTLPVLLTEFAETLAPSDEPDSVKLKRQIATLDRVFDLLMNDMVLAKLDTQKYYAETPQGWLDYALRIQKQCTDTVKARAVNRYMDALGTK